MSRFYASIEGQAKTEASRRGSASSGISGHVRGWDVGIKVIGFDDKGEDRFDVYLTGGSNKQNSDIFLGTASVEDGEIIFEPEAWDGKRSSKET